MANKEQKTVYYHTTSDEFGPEIKKTQSITGNYKYNRDNIFVRLFDFVSYRVILTPIAFIYRKFIARIKVVGKEKLKAEKEGAIIYANHTHPQADAFGPSTYTFPRRISVVVSAANVSLPVMAGLTKSWGALPLPADYESSKNFIKEVRLRLTRKEHLLIYPEAHLWPYYTGIRPFSSKSFGYPVQIGAKVYTFTATYQTTKKGKMKRIVYIDGPFVADKSLPRSAQAESLRDQVYANLEKRAEMSTYQKIKYIHKEKEVWISSMLVMKTSLKEFCLVFYRF